MGARSKARKRALDVLYEASQRSADPMSTLRERLAPSDPPVPEKTLGTVRDYLLENMEATVALHDGEPLYVELPASVELVVAHTDPGLQGDRSTGGTKPATLETGAEIQVPLFLTTGEKIKVDTRDGRYLGRVS